MAAHRAAAAAVAAVENPLRLPSYFRHGGRLLASGGASNSARSRLMCRMSAFPGCKTQCRRMIGPSGMPRRQEWNRSPEIADLPRHPATGAGLRFQPMKRCAMEALPAMTPKGSASLASFRAMGRSGSPGTTPGTAASILLFVAHRQELVQFTPGPGKSTTPAIPGGPGRREPPDHGGPNGCSGATPGSAATQVLSRWSRQLARGTPGETMAPGSTSLGRGTQSGGVLRGSPHTFSVFREADSLTRRRAFWRFSGAAWWISADTASASTQ